MARADAGAREARTMAQAAAGKTNWFAIWVSVAVVVVIALVIGLVVWMNNAATDPGTAPSGSGIDQETGAVVVGGRPAPSCAGPNTCAGPAPPRPTPDFRT